MPHYHHLLPCIFYPGIFPKKCLVLDSDGYTYRHILFSERSYFPISIPPYIRQTRRNKFCLLPIPLYDNTCRKNNTLSPPPRITSLARILHYTYPQYHNSLHCPSIYRTASKQIYQKAIFPINRKQKKSGNFRYRSFTNIIVRLTGFPKSLLPTKFSLPNLAAQLPVLPRQTYRLRRRSCFG